MVLDRNPSNYFAEVEQLAFAPAHMVPGIEPSPDKMLQARLFSYADTHRHRLGVNYQSIPVNCPFSRQTSGSGKAGCPMAVRNYQRDGPMNTNGNQGDAPNYFPNSFSGPQPVPSTKWHADRATGNVERVETGDEDNFTQCGQFFRKVLDNGAKQRLVENIAGSLSGAQTFIQDRAIANFAAADAQFGRMLREKLEELRRKKPASTRSSKANPLNPPRTVVKSNL
jgi:catalase